MLLLDGTAFSVGPNSSVVLDRFIYNPETAEGSLEVTARGLLRIVGGKVTKKQPALIRTNSATVGIRGGNWDSCKPMVHKSMQPSCMAKR